MRKYNFPEGSEPADFERMTALYKSTEINLSRYDYSYSPQIATIIGGGMVVASVPGVMPLFVGVGAALSVLIGGYAWWRRKQELDAEGMLQLYIQRWFQERGYWIRWGGHYEELKK
jgi:hypothetical protein